MTHQIIEILRRRIPTGIEYIVLFFAGWQSVYAFSQWLGIFSSGHPDYPFTGSFYNPGPFACYMAVCFPLAIRMYCCDGRCIQKMTGVFIALACALLIPVTLSRTALTAGSVGCLITLSDKLKKIFFKRWRLILSLALCLTIGATIYVVKKDSADGRMLMWKVAAQAATEIPVTGVGWDNVAGTYGEAQERYFASGKGSEQEIMVADAPEYVFNEYLQVAIAYGPIAAAGMVFLIIGGLVTSFRNKACGFAGSVAAVAVVMFASYPLQFPVFVITIALILIGAWLYSSARVIRWGSSLVIIAMMWIFLSKDKPTDVWADFSAAHSLHQTGRYRKSNDMLRELLPHTSDPMPLNILGKNYRALGIPDSAEYYLMRSTHRCPNRLYPHYLLMQLYGDSLYFNPIRQRREAIHILNTREKISSRAVDEMRQEARKVLNQ